LVFDSSGGAKRLQFPCEFQRFMFNSSSGAKKLSSGISNFFVMVYRSCGSIRLSVPKGWVLIVTNTHKSEASIKLEESYMVLGNNKPSDLLFEIFGSSCFVKPLSLSSLVFKS
jgi:hypothetical protein